MSAAAFDTLQFAKKLKAVKLSEEQAETVAEALRASFDERDKALAAVETKLQDLSVDTKRNAEKMATKEDVLKLDGKIDLVRKDVDLVRKDLVAVEKGLNDKMSSLEDRLVIKLGKIFAIGVTLILAAIGLAARYLSH